MLGKTIEHPRMGWTDVPGDPDQSVWWDGTTFTHSAIRMPSGWEVISDDDEWVATPPPAPDSPPKPTPRSNIGTRSVIPGPAALLLFCASRRRRALREIVADARSFF